jgi:histidinol dehydrogenase
VRHAGAIFLGRYTPEAVGDYVAGSNHVLPTSRAARFQSGLSLYDFLKRTSIVRATPPRSRGLARRPVAWPRPRACRLTPARPRYGCGH